MRGRGRAGTRRSYVVVGILAAVVVASGIVGVRTLQSPEVASGWQQVALGRVLFRDDASMNDITVGGTGLVAVGGTGDGQAAVWTSPDGVDWTRVPHDEAVFGGPGDQTMDAVVAGGPGLVAVGVDGAGEDRVAAAVWTSVDGVAWSRVPHDEAAFGGPWMHTMIDVVAGGPGLVAVGEVVADGWVATVVWTSVDGRVWKRVPHDDAVFGGRTHRRPRAATVVGPGVVVVGEQEDAGWVVWTSADGVTWGVTGGDSSTAPGESMEGVVTGGPGLVAVGTDWSGAHGEEWEASVAAVWTSVDGSTWSRVPHDDAVFGGAASQHMEAVAEGGPGLVAVGGDYSRGRRDRWGGAIEDAAVWTSVDGSAWDRVQHDDAVFGGARMTAVVSSGPLVLALGSRYPSLVTTGLWVLEPSQDAVATLRGPRPSVLSARSPPTCNPSCPADVQLVTTR